MANDAALLKKVAALADTSALADYQGKPTVSTSIAVTNTGDGLSQAMAVEPVTYPVGSKQYVVIECDVDAHDHALNESDEAFHLKQKFKGGTALVVDADLVAEMVTAQRDRIREAKDKAAGILDLPFGDGETTDGDGTGDAPADEVGTRRRSKRASKKAAPPAGDA